MTKSDRSKNRSNAAKSDGKTQSSNPSNVHSNAILKINRATRNNDKIKATFKDIEGNETKELIFTYNDNDQKELLIDLEKQLLKLGDRYGLFSEGKWKYLCQIGGRALEGRCAEYWQDIVEGATSHSTGSANAQRGKFIKLMQRFNEKCLSKHALDIQKDAMETGEMRYEGHDHEKVAERLFQINDDLELFSQDADKFSIRDMARKIIPRNLKTSARLKYLDKAGDELRDKEDIIALCARISYVLSAEVEAERKRKQDERSRNNSGDNQNQNGNTNLSDEEKEKRDSAPCRKHNGAHQWKDCPENWHNKNRHTHSSTTPTTSTTSSARTLKSDKGEVKSTESEAAQSHEGTPIIRFQDNIESDDESTASSNISRGGTDAHCC